MKYYSLLFLLIPLFQDSCSPKKPANTDVGKLGASKEVTEYLNRFEGRGALNDDSEPLSVEKALAAFQVASDLKMDLVLSEPRIFQPVEMKFDRKGRLWVVQYNQYPYPKGLKITGVDEHLRLQFDGVPSPPPHHVRGADKITFFEDTDGDGKYDKSTDAITGLNIATSVLLGKKRIWVLNPPYLLAYWDRDGNGIPEGEPEVHLEGFGLEDTHAVANSLRWGPDGWIYGAQGSTATANVTSKSSRNVQFTGQAIWRYHPETHIFEIYGEGGGNTFNIEIDAEGKTFSGQNGYGRGPYYKQGGYYKKSWGKHGPLTNPYAFGYLEDMAFEGENSRFTHALIRYEGGALPSRYDRNFIALNPLQGNIVLTGVVKDGSSMKNKDLDKIVDTPDRWFRPIDIKIGPDGNVYFTDWYDSRLSHVDARDTWHKSSGRIYRLSAAQGKQSPKTAKVDFTILSPKELVNCFYSPNRTVRFTALEELGDRADASVIPFLRQHMASDTSSIALESLWALNSLGGFDKNIALIALQHRNSLVREWAVRLIGDRKKASDSEAAALLDLSKKEADPGVRSQLAASARRLPDELCIGIVKHLVIYHDDLKDPDIPLMIWWALESKAETARQKVLSLFMDADFRSRPVTADVLLGRIVQRYAMAGGEVNYAVCEKIISQPVGEAHQLKMLVGLEEGIRGIPFGELPEGLRAGLNRLRSVKGEPSLAAGLRKNDAETIREVLRFLADETASQTDKLTYVRMMREGDYPESIPSLLRLLGSSSASGVLKQAVLSSLAGYNNPEIGERIIELYPDYLLADNDVRLAALSLLTGRISWAKSLLLAAQGIKKIDPSGVPVEMVNRMKLLGDQELENELYTIWPQAKESSGSEKSMQIAAIQKALRNGKGDETNGKKLYELRCGSCHRLFEEGGDIGPELTGYDRRDVNYFILNTVDPNAEIREGYTTYTLHSKAGHTVVGRLVERSARSVRIKPIAGEEQAFSMQEVDKLEPLPVSLMPERLLDDLSEQEIRDLFAFLMRQAKQ